MSFRGSRVVLKTIALSSLLLPALIGAQAPVDTVTGRVALLSGLSAQGVDVVVTPVGSSASVSARTDSAGRFEVHVDRASQYLVFARSTDGATKRAVVDRSANGRTEANLILEPVRTLPTVSVKSRRSPNVGSRLSSALGQNEMELDLSSSALSPSEQGTLAGTLAVATGTVMNADGSGFSTLGLGSEQNRMSFNGSTVEKLTLPRSTPVVIRLNTSPSDVSKGGFSGGLLTIEPRTAGNFITTSIGISGQPSLDFANDPATRQLGSDERNLLADFAHTGPVRWDKLAYTVSGQLGRRTAPVTSLLELNKSALAKIGIDPSGVSSLVNALGSAGFPSTFFLDHRTLLTNEGSFMGRLDFGLGRSRSTNLTSVASFSDVKGLGGGAESAGANGFTAHSRNQSTQFEDERTVHKAILNDFRAGYSSSTVTREPEFELPCGLVLLPQAQNAVPVVPVSFGGAAYSQQRAANFTLNLSNTASWFSADGTHLRKASIEAEQERIRNTSAGRTLGVYTFLNTDDVSANNAVSFLRELGSSVSRGSFSTLSASLGDTWDNQSDFIVQYGLRLDAFRAAPDLAFADIPELPSRNIQITPRWKLGLSPRLGFSRTYTLGAASPGSVARRIVVSGGSGVFRSTGARTVVDPLTGAGWRSATASKLLCIGSSVPHPDWRAFATSTKSIPTRCAGETSALRDSSGSLAILDRDFVPPFSWRTNFAASERLGDVRVGLEGIVSVNRSQRDLRDINQIDAARFTLASEGGRPVFVDPSAIDASGLLSTASNRVLPGYGAIWSVGSNLWSLSRQLGINVQSANPGLVARRSWQVSYAHSWVTDHRRGFEASTISDPNRIEREPGLFESSHQLILRGSSVFGSSERIEVSGYLRANSGFRFTPLVESDINGDGLINDRAWIFDANGVDSVSAGIRHLVTSAPRNVRSCLLRQADHFAGAQSCTGPWSVSSTLNVALRGDALRLPSRSRVTISVVNPVALADRVLHGVNTRGWGRPPFVDPYLYSVKGFRSASQQFEYVVNPNFGSTLARGGSTNPFRVSISESLPVGPTRGAQTVETDLALGRWRSGPRMTAQDLSDQHISTIIGFDPLARIGSGRDSTRYTGAQLRGLRSAIAVRDSALKSIFQEAANFAASLGPEPTRSEKERLLAMRKVATDSAVAALITTGEAVSMVLTPDQVDMLSPAARAFLSRDDILHLRRLGFFVY